LKNAEQLWFENNLKIQLIIQSGIPAVPTTFEPFFYQTARYLNAQEKRIYFSFYLFRNDEIPAIAFVHFIQDGIDFISPAKAPFGGIQCGNDSSAGELYFLLSTAERWMSEQDPDCIFIKTAPFCYEPESGPLLSQAYALSGFEPFDTQVNHHIPVSRVPFRNTIKPSERRRLLKCESAGFKAGILFNPDTATVYNFISESRAAKGYVLTLTFEELGAVLNYPGGECLVFIVTNGDIIIAMTVTIRVNKEILYNFLPAGAPAYQSYSPMVILLDSVYQYCRDEVISIFDLGISVDHHGLEKPDLIRFKENIGGKQSTKITYRKVVKTKKPDMLL
jgi:hypothetical protein